MTTPLRSFVHATIPVVIDSFIAAGFILSIIAWAQPQNILRLPQHRYFSFTLHVCLAVAAAFLAIRFLYKILNKKRTLSRIEQHFPRVLVGCGIILACISLLPLWLPGPPLNQDTPLHYQKIWGCLQSPMHSLVTSWNPYLNGGRAPFQAYPVLPFLFVSWLTPFMGLEAAFKLILVAVHFILPIIAYRFFSFRGSKTTAAVAFLTLLLQPGYMHSGGYSQVFVFGMFSSVLASGLLLWCIDRTLRYVKQPTGKNFASLSLAAGLTLLSHIMQFSLLLLFLPLIWLVFGSKLRIAAGIIAASIGAVSLAGFWALPLAETHLSGVYINPFTVSCGQTLFSVADIKGFLFETVYPGIWLFVLLGIVLAFLYRQRDILAVTVCTGGVCLLWGTYLYLPNLYAALPWAKLMELERSFQDFRTLGLILASYGIGLPLSIWLERQRNRRSRAAIALFSIFLFWITVLNASGTFKYAALQLNLSEELELQYLAVYRTLPAEQGRVLHQEVLGHFPGSPLNHTHLENYCPVISGRETIAFDGINMGEDLGGFGIEKFIRNSTPEAMQKFFQRWNIVAVIVSSPGNVQQLSWLKDYYKSSSWTVFHTGIEAGYFELTRGTVINSNYAGFSAWIEIETPETAVLTFKMHDHPNWRVIMDEKILLNKTNKPGAQIEVEIPRGHHRIKFAYAYRLLDFIAYLLTFLSCGMLILIAVRDSSYGSTGALSLRTR